MGVAMMFLVFNLALSREDDGKMTMFKDMSVVSEVKSEDESDVVNDIGSRNKPDIVATMKKLSVNQTYNLVTIFNVKGRNADGQDLTATLVELKDSSGRKLTVSGSSYKFTQPGVYVAKYNTKETYKGTVLSTDKSFKIVVD